MISQNMPWLRGMDYGVGVNFLTGSVHGKGVIPGPVTSPQGAPGMSGVFSLTVIKDTEALQESLGLSVEAGGHYGFFSAEGKFNYSKEMRFNSQSTFVLAKCIVENPFTQCADGELEKTAADLIRDGKPDVFRTRFGDGYVRGMQTGGEFYSLVTITSSRTEDQEQLGAHLHAEYESFFAGGEIDADFKKEIAKRREHSQITVYMFQRGGVGSELEITDDVVKVMGRMRDFPTIVRDHPVTYAVQVASYETLDLPEGPSLIQVEAQHDELQRHALLRLRLMKARSDVEFVQDHPRYFISPPPAQVLNTWNQFFSDQLTELTAQADACSRSPQACTSFAYTQPDDYELPVRKAGDVSGQWKHVTEGVGEAIWDFTPLDDSTYEAVETGLGNARGRGKLEGTSLRVPFSADGGTVGTYTWNFDSALTGGEGTLVFSYGQTHVSRILRVQ